MRYGDLINMLRVWSPCVVAEFQFVMVKSPSLAAYPGNRLSWSVEGEFHAALSGGCLFRGQAKVLTWKGLYGLWGL